MFIARLCALMLLVFSGLLNSNCTMIDIQEKQHVPCPRTARQSRPILNGILLLLATNIIAKGILGLHAYTPPTPSNLQGSVYLNFGRPTQPASTSQQQHQFLPYSHEPFHVARPYTYWNPIQNTLPYPTPGYTLPTFPPTSTSKPQAPIQQHQIINIHDNPFSEDTPDAQYQDESLVRTPTHHIVISPEKQLANDAKTGISNRRPANVPQRAKDQPLTKNPSKEEPSTGHRRHVITYVIKRETDKTNDSIITKQKVRPALELFKLQPQQYKLINKLAHLKRQVSKEFDRDSDVRGTTTDNVTSLPDVEVFGSTDKYEYNVTFAKQVAATTLPPTTASTTTASTTSVSTTTATTIAAPPPTTATTAATTAAVTAIVNATGNDTSTGYSYGYGPYTGNENVSLTTSGPAAATTFNTTANETITNATMIVEPGYYYAPAQEQPGYGYGYGPSNGNENISITYGPPPSYNNYDGNQPFYSSAVDHYLNSDSGRSEYDHRHYDNTDQHNDHNDGYSNDNENLHNQSPYPYPYPYPYHNQVQQFNDAVHKFYNKYDYHYPYFTNYLGN